MPTLPQNLEKLIGQGIRASKPLTGGSIASIWRVTCNDGSELCVKACPRQEMAEAEAKGLKLLNEAGAIKVPALRRVEGPVLIMDFISSGPKDSGFFKRFGKELAELHKRPHHSFGLDSDNYIGLTPQKNTPPISSTSPNAWASFFFDYRLQFQLELIRSTGRPLNELRRQFQAVTGVIMELLQAVREPPSLLHGDLWFGNYIAAIDGTPYLIDPAVSYGHREFDLAMSTLFGGFHDDFYRSYQNSFPLQTGWKDRELIYQLYQLLNHYNLFGGEYYGQVKAILDALMQLR